MPDTGTFSPQPCSHSTILMGHVSASCLERADATTLFLQALQTTGRIGQVVACAYVRVSAPVYGFGSRGTRGTEWAGGRGGGVR